MGNLGLIIGSTLLISLGALIGVVTVGMNKKRLEKILVFLISLSAGAMMGGAFLHLLPESLEMLKAETVFLLLLAAFAGFFLIEKLLHWRHCHKYGCTKHLIGHMNLFGDSVHNFIDGLVIAAAFGASVSLGWVTVLAVALHEIPQEIGDFGVLIYSGWKRSKALIYNFLAALMVVVGGVVGYWLSTTEVFIGSLMSIAAGGFIYIAASDLMPELKKETDLKKSMGSFGIFLLGIGLMWLLKILLG